MSGGRALSEALHEYSGGSRPWVLLYAPKWMRDERRVQECVEEIQELIPSPHFHPPPAALPNVEEDGVPHWLAPNLTPEGPPVRRRSTVGMIVCFLLAMAVPAIAAPFAANKFPAAEAMTTAAERSN